MASRSLQLERYQNFHNGIHTHLGIGEPDQKRIPIVVTRGSDNFDGSYYPRKITIASKKLTGDVVYHEIAHRLIRTKNPDFKNLTELLSSKKKETVAKGLALQVADEGLANFIGEETHFRQRFSELIKIFSSEESVHSTSFLYALDRLIDGVIFKLTHPKRLFKTWSFIGTAFVLSEEKYQQKLDEFDDYVKCHWVINMGKRRYEKNGKKVSASKELQKFWDKSYIYIVGFTFVRRVMEDLIQNHGLSLSESLDGIMQYPPTTLDELRDIPAYVESMVDSL